MTTVRCGTSLATGLAITGLSLHTFWVDYFTLGGTHAQDELLAYLHDDIAWTTGEHDVAAHTLNEGCTTLGLGYPVLTPTNDNRPGGEPTSPSEYAPQ